MIDVTCTVNLNGLEQRLNEIGPKLAKSHLRKALKVGAQILEDEAKSRAPVDTGALRDSITTVIKMRASADAGRASVGPAYNSQIAKQGGVTSQDPGVYAKFVELGLESKEYKRQPFLRPAFDSKAQEVVEKFVEVLREGLTEVTK